MVVGVTGSIVKARMVPPSGPLLVQISVPTANVYVTSFVLTSRVSRIRTLNKRNKKELVLMGICPSQRSDTLLVHPLLCRESICSDLSHCITTTVEVP